MRRVSLNAREAQDAQSTEEIEIALFAISHPDLDAPVRLSTDNTERLSVDPLMYGTRSSWDGADPETDPYLFVVASADLPSDKEDAPASTSIILANLDQDMVHLMRSFTGMATVHMAVVLASSPDLVEVEYRDLRIVGAGGNVEELELQLSRRPIEEETVPMDRFTKDRFPGMFR